MCCVVCCVVSDSDLTQGDVEVTELDEEESNLPVATEAVAPTPPAQG